MPESADLAESAWLMTRSVGLLVLGRMREIEERVADPGARWDLLRDVLRQFSEAERRPE